MVIEPGVWAGLGLLLGGGEGDSDHGQRKGKHRFFSFEPFAVVPFSLVAPLLLSPVTAKFRVHDQVRKVRFTFFRQTGKTADGFLKNAARHLQQDPRIFAESGEKPVETLERARPRALSV